MRFGKALPIFAVMIELTFAASTPDPAYAPLWLYSGTWRVSRNGANPDELKNDCALIGKYFACQQTVNGTPGELLIFIPADKPGHYYTQTVMPQGRAGGRGDLEINGDRWIYSSNWDDGGKTTFYRTTNVFTGKDHIHFEQAESTNHKDWKVTASGDEVHVSGARTKTGR